MNKVNIWEKNDFYLITVRFQDYEKSIEAFRQLKSNYVTRSYNLFINVITAFALG